LELFDYVGAHCVVIDVGAKTTFFGHNFKLRDLEIESTRDLDDYLPNLLLRIHYYFMGNVVRVKLNHHFDVVLFIILLNVFKRDMHVVEPVQVGAN